MAMDEWEVRWEDDGGCPREEPSDAPTREGQVAMPSGIIVVAAIAPFFLCPILGMALGRLAGALGLLAGTVLGFVLAIGIARILGKRLESRSTR